MKKSSKKSRFFYLHPDCNDGKIGKLEELHEEYLIYLSICIQTMLDAHLIPRSEKKLVFPRAENLTSHIEANARDHAIQVIFGWASSIYVRKLLGHITRIKRDGQITSEKPRDCTR